MYSVIMRRENLLKIMSESCLNDTINEDQSW